MNLTTKDLRDGNIVYLTKDNFKTVKEYELDAHDIYKLSTSDCADVKPIELNEEWLKRCKGFEKDGEEYKNGVFTLTWMQRFCCYILWKKHLTVGKDCHIMNLEYLHTLQNIWPLLNMNEELEITKTT